MKGFRDIFYRIKMQENETAISGLKSHLAKVDAIHNEAETISCLLQNVLAGNIYDWGSSNVAGLLQDGLEFESAKGKLGFPDKFNKADLIVQRFSSWSPGYSKVAIFVDNSGYGDLFSNLSRRYYFRDYSSR